MPTPKQLVHAWFALWESGDFQDLPLTEDFKHTSPYGVIEGKVAYLRLVESNRDKFLGHRFELHDELYGEETACVRYTAEQGTFRLDVSEWYCFKGDQIQSIIAYYNIPGEVRADRQLDNAEEYKRKHSE